MLGASRVGLGIFILLQITRHLCRCWVGRFGILSSVIYRASSCHEGGIKLSRRVWVFGFTGGMRVVVVLLMAVFSSLGAEMIRPLHGVNKGPVAFGGLIDLSREFRAAGIPHIRLHDCQWPYPDVVDIHAIFRNPGADANDVSNYDFVLTDEYVAGAQATGAKVIYRLGESIEHAKTKRFVHPPKDVEKWTEICRTIVGRYKDVEYWEIWNEPENRPAMWTGTDEDFLALYRAAATGLKRDFPERKFGGPGLGYTGEVSEGEFKPSAFLLKFLAFCREERAPLDFFSWHCYTDDPEEIGARARGLRKLLDEHGFAKTELHLNEWNYLPNKSWEGAGANSTGEARAKFAEALRSGAAAAFVAATLIELQDAPVDVANFFHGETGVFGLFDEHGRPNAIYDVFAKFNRMANKPRVPVKSHGPIYRLATTNAELSVNYSAEPMTARDGKTDVNYGAHVVKLIER